MKVLNLSGGRSGHRRGRRDAEAPAFVMDDARAARALADWVQSRIPEIREQSTSSVARLLYIDPYVASKFAYLRFNFSTGDAAGQNMVGKATLAACNWILDHYEGIQGFFLESNFATDKKASQINVVRTRGKRVAAEVTIPRDILVRHLRVEPQKLAPHYGVANVGAFLSGANSNGAQSANGITAMFIATGQDVANVAESSASVLYSELTASGDFYISLTIPSLIVATYGGGTGSANATGVPRNVALLRQEQGQPAGGDCGGCGAGGRGFARRGDFIRGLGVQPRNLRAQPVERLKPTTGPPVLTAREIGRGWRPHGSPQLDGRRSRV
jgi:hydroxymethylglutaryl-CoA reductase (NADPH)